MAFNPNQLLTNPASLLSVKGLVPPGGAPAPIPAAPPPVVEAAPVPPPPFDPTLYENAFSRLGMLNIANVADLGCGPGNFTSVMAKRNQRKEVYIGVDISHGHIKTARAAYPDWTFIYGDFRNREVIERYERFDAYLLLNVMDVLEDDLAFLDLLPPKKLLLFDMPRFAKPGSLRYHEDASSLRDRYSAHLSIRSVGRLRLGNDAYHMVVGERW
jgi:trans-aconitate methyltransferase